MIYILPFAIGMALVLSVFFILIKTVINFRIKQIAYKNQSPQEKTSPESTPVERPATLEKFPVKIGDKVIFVECEHIAYLQAKDNYVYLNDVAGNEYLIDSTLKAIEGRLPSYFLRIHRSTIVNKNTIKEIHKYFNGKYSFILRDEKASKIISSLSYRETVKVLFDI